MAYRAPVPSSLTRWILWRAVLSNQRDAPGRGLHASLPWHLCGQPGLNPTTPSSVGGARKRDHTDHNHGSTAMASELTGQGHGLFPPVLYASPGLAPRVSSSMRRSTWA